MSESNSDPNLVPDARADLADSLRDFFIQAISQQETQDIEQIRSRSQRPHAGYLYKVDGPFLKVLLEEPAEDELLHEAAASEPEEALEPTRLPLIWVSIEITDEDDRKSPRTEEEVEEYSSHLEALVFTAEDIFVRIVNPGQPDVKKVCSDGGTDSEPRFVDDVGNVGDAPSFTTPSREEQIEAALDLSVTLDRYAIRTIRSTPSAEVA